MRRRRAAVAVATAGAAGAGEGCGGGGGGRDVSGVVVKGDAVLGEPLPEWRATLHRFRSFSLNHSPCRH